MLIIKQEALLSVSLSTIPQAFEAQFPIILAAPSETLSVRVHALRLVCIGHGLGKHISIVGLDRKNLCRKLFWSCFGVEFEICAAWVLLDGIIY